MSEPRIIWMSGNLVRIVHNPAKPLGHGCFALEVRCDSPDALGNYGWENIELYCGTAQVVNELGRRVLDDEKRAQEGGGG
jgi:hypothetical protein